MVLDANVPKLGSFPCLLSPTFWESNKEQTSSLFLKAGSWHLCPHALCRLPFLPHAGLGHQPGGWHARSDLFLIVTPQLVLTQLIIESSSPWAGFLIQPHFDFLENKDYTSTWKLLMHKTGLQSWLSLWRSEHFYWQLLIKILEECQSFWLPWIQESCWEFPNNPSH